MGSAPGRIVRNDHRTTLVGGVAVRALEGDSLAGKNGIGRMRTVDTDSQSTGAAAIMATGATRSGKTTIMGVALGAVCTWIVDGSGMTDLTGTS